MKKTYNIKLISAIIFVPILVIISFFILNIVDKSNNVPKVHTEVQEWGKYSGINIKTRTETANDYSLSISTPTTSSENINDTIQNWIDDEEQKFFTQFKETSNLAETDLMAHFNIQLKINSLNDHIYNFVFTTYTYLGGANGENKTKAFTVDLENDHMIELVDLIELQDKNKLKYFIDEVNQAVNNDETLTEVVDDQLLEGSLENYDYLQWSFNQDTLRFYFDEYEIAAGSVGIVKLDIPLENLTKLVQENIVEKYQLTAIAKQIEKERQQEKVEAERKAAEEKKLEEEKRKAEEKKAAKKEKETKENESQKTSYAQGNEKYVALTFDDGPSDQVTPEILRILQDYDAAATFFMLGSQIDYYPGLAAEVVQQGHEVGNHTQRHVDLTTVNQSEAKREIDQSREKIKNITGHTTDLVRPPYGAYNDTILNIIAGNNESVILWSVDPQDWRNRSPQSIAQHVIDHVQPGSIVLLHDIHQRTADALPAMLSGLADKGYTFVTVSQLIELQNMETMEVIRGNP